MPALTTRPFPQFAWYQHKLRDTPQALTIPLWLSQLMQLSQHRTLLIISHIPHSNSSALFH